MQRMFYKYISQISQDVHCVKDILRYIVRSQQPRSITDTKCAC